MAARDFSCSVVGANHELLSCPEGIPVHVFGASLSAASMVELHPDFREGDAFLHNDPYQGNSHAADTQVIAPVFVDGEHLFTALTKAHMIDCGNALPTTYMAMARDVYEEGAIIFPCVRVEEDYRENRDIIRIAERRIRGFDVWYGDYLAGLGAVRLAERRLKEFCASFGVKQVKRFITEWLDYSERMAAAMIATLPAGRVIGKTGLEPFPVMPNGIPLSDVSDVDPEAGKVVVDERLVVPTNAGTFRRIEVLLRENCVVGIPRHPVSASVATNTVADRVIGMVMTAFADLGEGLGLGEPCYGLGPYLAVISGQDPRRKRFFIFQMFAGTAGGPAGPEGDGWLSELVVNAGGLIYIDSTELVEQKNPLVIWHKSVRTDSDGAGENRGAPGNLSIYGPRLAEMEAHYIFDGVVNRPRGVRGGGSPLGPEAHLVHPDGTWEPLPDPIGAARLKPRESIVSLSAGGGGYGDPLERDPARVLEDVVDDWISPKRAVEAYGVVLIGDPERWETLRVDGDATASERSRLRLVADRGEGHRLALEPLRWWAGADLRGAFSG
jgi:N-methylhydantoinase B